MFIVPLSNLKTLTFYIVHLKQSLLAMSIDITLVRCGLKKIHIVKSMIDWRIWVMYTILKILLLIFLFKNLISYVVRRQKFEEACVIKTKP